MKAYIAGIGMITSIGANSAMIAASVRTGISGYSVSDYYNHVGEPITLALLPEVVFGSVELDTREWDYCSEQYERVIKMAIIALREAGRLEKIAKTTGV